MPGCPIWPKSRLGRDETGVGYFSGSIVLVVGKKTTEVAGGQNRIMDPSFLYISFTNVKGNQSNQLILDFRGKFRTKINLSRRIFDGFQNFRQLRTGNYALSSGVGCRNYRFYLDTQRDYAGIIPRLLLGYR